MSVAAFSAATTIGADGLVLGIPGKIDASTMKMLSLPYTLVFVSTTEVPPVTPESVPILQVPSQWFERRAPMLPIVRGICVCLLDLAWNR